MPNTLPILLSVADTCAATGLPRSTLYALLKQGFPSPVRLGRRIAFRADEVREWAERLPRAWPTPEAVPEAPCPAQ